MHAAHARLMTVVGWATRVAIVLAGLVVVWALTVATLILGIQVLRQFDGCQSGMHPIGVSKPIASIPPSDTPYWCVPGD
jgi:hypothetical protein